MIEYFRLSDRKDYSLEDVTRFNDEVYPYKRPNNVYDKYRFVDNPFATETKDFLYIATYKDSYIGQLLTWPARAVLGNQIIDTYWGHSYFVKSNFRKKGVGSKLLELSIQKQYYMGYGMTSMSKNIHKRAGLSEITHIDFFQKWGTSIKRLNHAVKRRISKKEATPETFNFPSEIGGFKRITSASQLKLPSPCWNSQIIETYRNAAYMDWRFFYKRDRYFMYAVEPEENRNSPYFVVRPMIHLNSYWLQVVDYRCNLEEKGEFEQFLTVLEQLRRRLKLTGVLISSSLKFTNVILGKKDFKGYKRRKVVTSYPFECDEPKDSHNACMVNLADSDWDMYDHFGNFIFAG